MGSRPKDNDSLVMYDRMLLWLTFGLAAIGFIMAVSYTHLDVYKRQSKGRLAVPTRYREGLIEDAAGQLVCTIDTVSYTHLDVYKRQPRWWPLPRAGWQMNLLTSLPCKYYLCR